MRIFVRLQFFALMLSAFGLSFQAIAAEQRPRNDDSSPGDHALALKVGDLDRHYTVHVPRTYDGKRPVPVVIMLHGGGGTGQGAARETLWNAKADQAGFLAVFPEATPPDLTKPGRFRGNPQTWNDGSGRFDAGRKGVDDIGFLNAMLDDLARRFTVDRRRIFVTGFSNGASMTFRVGEELSRRVAAIAPVAGACWADAPRLTRPVSMCYITGDSDPLNPLEGGEPKFASATNGIGGRRNRPSATPLGNGCRRWPALRSRAWKSVTMASRP